MYPDIDFHSIRLHKGNQENAFEELCCQLASDEKFNLPRKGFDRKGAGGDGGIECFATLSDGSEVGWQVKYYWEIQSALRSLDESFNKALVKHPAMSRFIVCIPFDLSDSRKEGVTTSLKRWNHWKTAALKRAAGRTIEIERWDAFELRKRLTSAAHTSKGRVAFWFNKTLLTHDWFNEAFDKTCVALGKRYSPESHIDLPVRRIIEAMSVPSSFTDTLKSFSTSVLINMEKVQGVSADVTHVCQQLIDCLTCSYNTENNVFPVKELRFATDEAWSVVATWHRRVKDSNEKNRNSQSSLDSIFTLLSLLHQIKRELSDPCWEHLDTRALIVTGDAGAGKSHLLADICRYTIQKGIPAVMILGHKLPDDEPSQAILRELDLHVSVDFDTFLGALNTAAKALGGRALLMVDALNEKNGLSIWPDHLASFRHKISKFDNISLVLSCRTTYMDMIIDDDQYKDIIPRIKHHGFSRNNAREYLTKRNITLGEEPNAVEELKNPLFLRICCDALQSSDNALLANNLGSVTEIFRLYRDAVVKSVNRQLGLTPNRRLIEQTISSLATEMAETGLEEIPLNRAYELVSNIFPISTNASHDLLFQLQNEGLLTAQPISYEDGQEEIRFTFQRMSDHAIATNLLERSVTNRDVTTLLSTGTPLWEAIDADYAFLPGVLEALSIQLPEKFGVELYDVPGIEMASYMDMFLFQAFCDSLLIRQKDSFSDRTWELIRQFGGEELRYEVLIALASEPERKDNATLLDTELRAMSMPERDSRWSAYLAQNIDHTSHFIEWAREADQSAVLPVRAGLASILLTWLLTTSSRKVRDTATKALVAILSSRPELSLELWSRFTDVDDTYVTERLICAIYGAAMQGQWANPELFRVVQAVHSSLSSNTALSMNALTRDHARGLIQYAASKKAIPPHANVELTFPASGRKWPIEYVTPTEMSSYKRTYRDGEKYRDEISLSCGSNGDFARYQLDYVIRMWSAAPKGSNSFPTQEEIADEWLNEFRATASPAMLQAYESFEDAMANANCIKGYIPKDTATKKAKTDFHAAIGEDAYAKWDAEASQWQSEGIFQHVHNEKDVPAQFNLAWARNWVCKRAHELGWSEVLHGTYDASIRHDRYVHTTERVGKKYQWIAFYELVARLSDDLEPMPEDDAGDISRLRNIDPSLLVSKSEDDGWQRFEHSYFWVPSGAKLGSATVDEALNWLDSPIDVPANGDNIEVTDPETNIQWLVLKGFETWRGKTGIAEREIWRRISAFVVRRDALEKALRLIKNTHLLSDTDIPSARTGGFYSHLGEHPWAWLNDTSESSPEHEWDLRWRPYGSTHTPVDIRPTTAQYRAEASGYDSSISQNIELSLPAPWLIEELDLHLSDGKNITYVDKNRDIVFMDPSLNKQGRSSALIAREPFLSMLGANDLVAIWVISGEKNVYGPTHSGGFGGRYSFTRIFHSQENDIVALDCYQTFEGPSLEQLEKLRKLED